MSKLFIVLRIALRNLFATRINVVIGLLILVGTFLIVVGGAVLDSIDSAMSRSVIGSIAGHAQLYSAESKEALTLYPDFGEEANVATLDNFEQLRVAVEKVPNVASVVPMGLNGAMVGSGNTIDLTLAKVRETVRERQEKGPSPELDGRYTAQKDLVKQMVQVLLQDTQKAQEILTERGVDPESVAALRRASDPKFWAQFDQAPLDSLEFLENKIAPLATDADLLFIRYVGTDLQRFEKTFDRMRIVDGKMPPPGERGLLFPKFFYEEFLKLKTARRLDKIKEARDVGKRVIAGDAELERWVKENASQTREILFQLDARKTAELRDKVKGFLNAGETELGPLLAQFLQTDDGNFDQRYAFWKKEIEPSLDLYRVRVGDTISIQAFTRSGYVQSINVPVWGTFEFSGLEKSPLAGGLSLMDLVSFRELYGFLSADKLEELKKIKAASGARDVRRETAEDELFGGGETVVAEATPGVIDERAELPSAGGELRRRDLIKRVYTQEELDQGAYLNAAVMFKDPKKGPETMRQIEQAASEAGVPVKVISWQQASGILGQFINVAKGILFFAVFVIFIVTLVIINNAMMMATLQRVREIGTMRAIGAQRGFVLFMVLTETGVLGVVFGVVGAALGAALVLWLKATGIPAGSEELYFFFSGPRLHPTLGIGNLVAAFVIIVVVSAVSTLYPAFLATRVAPVRAMQTDE